MRVSHLTQTNRFSSSRTNKPPLLILSQFTAADFHSVRRGKLFSQQQTNPVADFLSQIAESSTIFFKPSISLSVLTHLMSRVLMMH
ncbi:hypothetical protein MtrunA17_Chr5g0418801 [Medicago truncatula]|uniref:Uncharacterized protein n=1 Tax=Medicago truncatula TaxID=3880 RepID=I3SQ13_MEDTR|nr:unknown [Medicago truncatula]AFK42355.1 unknown [Medicago truncatula]RHN55526.1 hypothetical protein MtrunA17_Chr5g0418801 [Medicago truncatula]